MGLRDLLKKKDDLDNDDPSYGNDHGHGHGGMRGPDAPEFTLIRSDTSTEERVYPPTYPNNDALLSPTKEPGLARRSLDVFRSNRSSRSTSVSSQASSSGNGSHGGHGRRPLSERFHLKRDGQSQSSEKVPTNLPDIVDSDPQDTEGKESQWEKRATMLASQNDRASQSRSASPMGRPRAASKAVSSNKAIDNDIQEAIRLHEEGNLEQSTRLFGRLADPRGANNPLSQVLYGLALRHGWGCEPDPARAVENLSAAAASSATIEQLALQAGLKKGGAAKGELVLAIFELANCFRHGWGIPKDAYAAKQYYETAANLGDTDAMNEIAWCYLEGFGCKKDKYAAARYYRLAEKNGNKTLGNSWIWKEKYNPPGEGGGSHK